SSSRPRAPPPPTLFPYTTLFRSSRADGSSPAARITSRFGAHSRSGLRRRNARHGTSRSSPTDARCVRRGIHAARIVRFRRIAIRSEEHTSELQSPYDLVCRLLLE